MLRISGLILKKEGEVVVSNGKKAVIKWVEKDFLNRTFHYLVVLKGEKYTRRIRLRPYELDYWVDKISYSNLIKGDKKWLKEKQQEVSE